jgi:hypothetical protein
LGTLSDERRKLLKLYYADGISMEGFKEEEQRLVDAIESARAQATEEQLEALAMNDLELRFEQVIDLLRELNIDAFWNAANDEERKILIQELIEWVKVFPDHLEVKVSGAPPLNVLLGEVGLKVPEIVGVGGPKQHFCNHALAAQ